MSALPELSSEARKHLAELRELSAKAEGGNREARRELRRAVRSSSPEVIGRASDFARKGQRILIETISDGEPLMEEAISARLDLMRTELAGESPSALELLLVERIVSNWLLVEILETLTSAYFKRGEGIQRPPPSYLRFIHGWQESANRRFLASVRELARVRKLQSNTPGIQYNTQINVSAAEVGTPAKKASKEEPHH